VAKVADKLDWLDDLSPAEQAALLAEAKAELARFKLADYTPYEKQRLFHTLGADLSVRERLLIAGNQLGKTIAGSFECAMHLTGEYPDWWEGAVFNDPVTGWAASETGQGTRDTVQRLLLGEVGSWGTGAIPAHLILDIKRASGGTPDLVETIIVRHVPTGGKSRVTLKTYDQGRKRWQGETLDFVWFDEEPPEDIYMEGLTRTNATQGIVWVTFTPLQGMSDVVKRFLIDKHEGTATVTMTIYDAGHYTPEQRAQIIASYPAHEREARSMGIPTLGSGRIFPVPEQDIKEPIFSLPKHWPRIGGIDFGWDHPTAAVWMAYDRDTDTVHIYDCYRKREATPVIHAATICAKGKWIPFSWPHDGLQHDKGSGEQLASQYRNLGVKMLKAKATHAPDKNARPPQKEGEGGNGVEAGLMDMLDRMMTGRLKVAAHLADWFEEFRMYHRDEGKIVKVGDDLMSATRYAIMMLRHAAVMTTTQPPRVQGYQPSDAGMGL
jgi:phage terminase large subunit-like protein